MTAQEQAREKNLMAATWTKASTVRRKFKAGPPRRKDSAYGIERAVLEARILFVEVRKEMLVAKIPTTGEDVKMALVLMTPDTEPNGRVHLLPLPKDIGGLHELHKDAAKLEKKENAVPAGVAFWMRDREDNSTDVWVRQWLVSARASHALDAARKAFEASDGKETQATFE